MHPCPCCAKPIKDDVQMCKWCSRPVAPVGVSGTSEREGVVLQARTARAAGARLFQIAMPLSDTWRNFRHEARHGPRQRPRDDRGRRVALGSRLLRVSDTGNCQQGQIVCERTERRCVWRDRRYLPFPSRRRPRLTVRLRVPIPFQSSPFSTPLVSRLSPGQTGTRVRNSSPTSSRSSQPNS